MKRKRILSLLLAFALLAPMMPAAHVSALEGAIPTVIPIESNLSVKYWVTASASSNGADADLAIDGDLDTAWIAAGDNASLTVDLSGAYNAIYKTEVVFAGSASAYKYMLEGSADGVAWSTLADRSANTKVADGFTDIFKSPGIRYVRLAITAGSPVGVKEFRIFNYLRDDMKGGSDIGSAQTGMFYYNRNNDPPQMMPDGSREYRGGTGNEASIPTGNNFYGLAQDLGWETIRLRIWNEPRSEGGWATPGVWDHGNGISASFPNSNANGGSSPNATRNHARYVVGAGQQLAIDFHYADSWADPQNQPKTYAWVNLPWDDPAEPLRIPDMTVGAATRPETYNPDDDSQHKIITRGLVSEVEYFTYEMIKSLIDQGTAPSIVALGNETTHGMMWGKEYRLTNYYGPDTTYNDHHDYYHRFIRDNERSVLGTGSTYAERYATSTIYDREDIAYGGGVEWLNYDRANGDVNSAEYKSFQESVRRFAILIDAGQRAIHRLNEEYKDSPLLPAPMVTELHFANNVAAQPRGGGVVQLDPEKAFQKLLTLVSELDINLTGMSGMVDRIGLSYYPDWHGPTWMFQRNCVEIEKLVPGIKVNMSECGSGSQVSTIQEYLTIVNDVPNNAGMGVWPWSGSGSNGSFRSSQLAFAISHATGVVESGIYATILKGTAPALPATVKELKVSDGTVAEVPVAWSAIDPEDYAEIGATFTVSGTAEAQGNMNRVTATVTVVDTLLEGVKINTTVHGEGQQIDSIVLTSIDADVLDGLTAADFAFSGRTFAYRASRYDTTLNPASPMAYRTPTTSPLTASITDVAVDKEAKTVTLSVSGYSNKYYYVDEYTLTCTAVPGLSFSNRARVQDDLSHVNTNGMVEVTTWVADDFEFVSVPKAADEHSDFNYYLFTPEAASSPSAAPLPLVLGNHGSGDQMNLLANRVVLSWAEPGVQDKNPAYVLAPVYPQPGTISGDSTDYEALQQDEVIAKTIALIRKMIADGKVDPDRVYITGKSMGGRNTIKIASLHPDLFAAAMPLNAARRNEADFVGLHSNNLKNMPVYTVISDEDGQYAGNTALHNALVALGNYRAKIFSYSPEQIAARGISTAYGIGNAHDVEIICYEDTRYADWMFSQKKPSGGAIDYIRVNTISPPRGHTIDTIDVYVSDPSELAGISSPSDFRNGKLTGRTRNWASSLNDGEYQSAITVPFEADITGVAVSGNKLTLTLAPIKGYVNDNQALGLDGTFNGFKKYFYVTEFSVVCLANSNLSFTKADVDDTPVAGADEFTQFTAKLTADFDYNLFTPTGTVDVFGGTRVANDTFHAQPLILVLHGSGDQKNLLANRMALAWAEPENQKDMPCYVLAPVFTNQSGTDNQRATIAKSVELIKKMIDRGLVDPDRVYVMGKSMGGSNTQRAYMEYPEVFAAAMSLSGGIVAEYRDPANSSQPSAAYIDSLKVRPFYIVHAEGDGSTPSSDNLYAALVAADAKMTAYKRYSTAELAVEAGDGIGVKPHDVEILCMEDPYVLKTLYYQAPDIAGIATLKEIDPDMDHLLSYDISVSNVAGTNLIEISAKFDNDKLTYAGTSINIPASYSPGYLFAPKYDNDTGEYTATIALLKTDTLFSAMLPTSILTVNFTLKGGVAHGDVIKGELSYVKVSEVRTEDKADTIDALLKPAAAETDIGTYLRYDINKDGVLNMDDIALIIFNYYLAQAGDPNWDVAKTYDANKDAFVNLADLLIICSYF